MSTLFLVFLALAGPAARVGDRTSHGGVIVGGVPTVIVQGQPAATVSSMVTCPVVTAGVPHVGGPILVGEPTVLIGGQPAARAGDVVSENGPPSVISGGAATVLIGG